MSNHNNKTNRLPFGAINGNNPYLLDNGSSVSNAQQTPFQSKKKTSSEAAPNSNGRGFLSRSPLTASAPPGLWTIKEEDQLKSITSLELLGNPAKKVRNDRTSNKQRTKKNPNQKSVADLDWERIAKTLGTNRTSTECKTHFERLNCINVGRIPSAPWTAEEDQTIIHTVRMHGTKKWALCASKLSGRTGKQCRERWHNHLNPDVIKSRLWSEYEDRVILEYHVRHGNKWAEMAKLLPGRTDNSIKNHWNASLSKRIENFLVTKKGVDRKYIKNRLGRYLIEAVMDECIQEVRPQSLPQKKKSTKKVVTKSKNPPRCNNKKKLGSDKRGQKRPSEKEEAHLPMRKRNVKSEPNSITHDDSVKISEEKNNAPAQMPSSKDFEGLRKCLSSLKGGYVNGVYLSALERRYVAVEWKVAESASIPALSALNLSPQEKESLPSYFRTSLAIFQGYPPSARPNFVGVPYPNFHSAPSVSFQNHAVLDRTTVPDPQNMFGMPRPPRLRSTPSLQSFTAGTTTPCNTDALIRTPLVATPLVCFQQGYTPVSFNANGNISTYWSDQEALDCLELLRTQSSASVSKHLPSEAENAPSIVLVRNSLDTRKHQIQETKIVPEKDSTNESMTSKTVTADFKSAPASKNITKVPVGSCSKNQDNSTQMSGSKAKVADKILAINDTIGSPPATTIISDSAVIYGVKVEDDQEFGVNNNAVDKLADASKSIPRQAVEKYGIDKIDKSPIKNEYRASNTIETSLTSIKKPVANDHAPPKHQNNTKWESKVKSSPVSV